MEYCQLGSLLSKKWKKDQMKKFKKLVSDYLDLEKAWKYFRDLLLGLDYSNIFIRLLLIF